MARKSKKDLILETAKQLFAEKGYDATGMEEIASRLEIPKSLIYYHFKGKEALLNAIIDGFIHQYSILLHDDSSHGIDKISVYMDFLKANRDCATILVGESLKSGSNRDFIFKILAPLMEMDMRQPPDERMDHAHWVTEFFTSILPSVLFACYEDSWCDTFGMTHQQLEKDYFTAYKLTHGAYHDHISKESL